LAGAEDDPPVAQTAADWMLLESIGESGEIGGICG
jgi:hypothetical protein